MLKIRISLIEEKPSGKQTTVDYVETGLRSVDQNSLGALLLNMAHLLVRRNQDTPTLSEPIQRYLTDQVRSWPQVQQ